MYLLYQPVDKLLMWYQSPLQSNDVKGDILDIVKIYNADAYSTVSPQTTTPMG